MVPLFVQTLPLTGALLHRRSVGVLIRRSLFAGARPAPTGARRVDPLPEVAELRTGPDRFGLGPRLEPAQPAPAIRATTASPQRSVECAARPQAHSPDRS